MIITKTTQEFRQMGRQERLRWCMREALIMAANFAVEIHETERFLDDASVVLNNAIGNTMSPLDGPPTPRKFDTVSKLEKTKQTERQVDR